MKTPSLTPQGEQLLRAFLTGPARTVEPSPAPVRPQDDVFTHVEDLLPHVDGPREKSVSPADLAAADALVAATQHLPPSEGTQTFVRVLSSLPALARSYVAAFPDASMSRIVQTGYFEAHPFTGALYREHESKVVVDAICLVNLVRKNPNDPINLGALGPSFRGSMHPAKELAEGLFFDQRALRGVLRTFFAGGDNCVQRVFADMKVKPSELFAMYQQLEGDHEDRSEFMHHPIVVFGLNDATARREAFVLATQLIERVVSTYKSGQDTLVRVVFAPLLHEANVPLLPSQGEFDALSVEDLAALKADFLHEGIDVPAVTKRFAKNYADIDSLNDEISAVIQKINDSTLRTVADHILWAGPRSLLNLNTGAAFSQNDAVRMAQLLSDLSMRTGMQLFELWPGLQTEFLRQS